MSTEKAFADLVVGLLQPGNVRVKSMFGEYCLYHNEKVVAFLCDNRVLLKRTEPALPQVEGLEHARVHPGSKLYHVVPDDRLDNPWFQETIAALSNALPAPKPKRKKEPAR